MFIEIISAKKVKYGQNMPKVFMWTNCAQKRPISTNVPEKCLYGQNVPKNCRYGQKCQKGPIWTKWCQKESTWAECAKKWLVCTKYIKNCLYGQNMCKKVSNALMCQKDIVPYGQLEELVKNTRNVELFRYLKIGQKKNDFHLVFDFCFSSPCIVYFLTNVRVYNLY